MKVLDLQCEHAHSFEGWFASEDDFRQQLERGLLSCPLCGSAQVIKCLSAPRLNLGASREDPESRRPSAADSTPAHPASAPVATLPPALQAQWFKAMRAVMAQTEDVGERFADEARAMHHGEIQERAIRGRTTPEVALELLEEGIDVLPLPALPALKETLQ